MGYTHYLYNTKKPEDIPDKALEILKEVIEEGWEKGILQLEYNDPSKPLVTKEEIRFNGKGEDGHETCWYSSNPKDSGWYFTVDNEYFTCCKTAFKPYDEYVMKVYLVLGNFIPSIRVSSDGDFNDTEWQGALKWAKTRGISVIAKEGLEFER